MPHTTHNDSEATPSSSGDTTAPLVAVEPTIPREPPSMSPMLTQWMNSERSAVSISERLVQAAMSTQKRP
ncbi:hypothetical protein AB5N19_11260 [Seiridium cardinale]|uniref:Uncharacterized protein n=1 Tax=Seiridium cardinale TaxID=138064 RepID=A0ABR2X9H1_9PEZI